MNSSILHKDDIKETLERVDSYDVEYFDNMIDMAIEHQEKESSIQTVKKIAVVAGVLAITGVVASPLIPILGFKSGIVIYTVGSLASVGASLFV